MNSLYVISFLNELELICLVTNIAIVSTAKWFKILPSNNNNNNNNNNNLIILFKILHLFGGVTSIGI